MDSLEILFITGLISTTFKENTDAIFLHGLVRHAFSPKSPIGGPFPSWSRTFHWDKLDKAIQGVDTVRLFRYIFPDKMNFTGSKPDLLISAEESGMEEFVRISKYALQGLSIYGRTGPFWIAAKLLEGGEGTQITLYYDADPCNFRLKEILKRMVRSRLILPLQLNKMSKEELDFVFGKYGSGYHKGEEKYYPLKKFPEEQSEEFQADEGCECEHWFFKMQQVPADSEEKILLYLNTLAVAVGKETAVKCMYAFGDDCFACKMSKVEAVTVSRKCRDKVVQVAPDLRLKASSERKYSRGMKVYADGCSGASDDGNEDQFGHECRVSVLRERELVS